MQVSLAIKNKLIKCLTQWYIENINSCLSPQKRGTRVWGGKPSLIKYIKKYILFGF